MSENNHSSSRGQTSSRRNQRRPYRKPQSRRPHFNLDPKVDEKLREIEDSGEPLSLAEQISRDSVKPNADVNLTESEAADVVNVTALQRMDADEIRTHAEKEGIPDVDSKSKAI